MKNLYFVVEKGIKFEILQLEAKVIQILSFDLSLQPGQLFSHLSARMRAKEIFDKLDVDGDGEITKTEFVEGYLMMMK